MPYTSNTTYVGGLPVTLIAGNDGTVVTPGTPAVQELLITGNRDAVTSNATRLVAIAEGDGDSVTTASRNMTFVAEGADATLTLLSTGGTALMDLTDATTGAAAATTLVSNANLVQFTTAYGAPERRCGPGSLHGSLALTRQATLLPPSPCGRRRGRGGHTRSAPSSSPNAPR